MILVCWLQTQTLAKCSSMRNPFAFGIANDDTRHVEWHFQRIQHHLRALRVHFQHNIRHIP